ncbi:MAG TPA: AraC family transcriptional regulator [Bacteroidales bacterium]|nr:AraC family transcriptional regulator [Bacteroidales bacterium]HPS61771.1 AraC family transcriptional regulator [Bacteroidales bacterium]
MSPKPKKSENVRTIHVKNMTCSCCVRLLRQELEVDGIDVKEVKMGAMTLSIDPGRITWKRIEEMVEKLGFEIIRDKEGQLVEQIKQAIIDLVHNTTYNAMVRNSDYLVERFGMSYPYLSTLFSRYEKTTLEKFTIMLKIEKVKELIEYGELTLSEIAYMMGYSSVQYLSTQFKSVTGVSVTEYKETPSAGRDGIDRVVS